MSRWLIACEESGTVRDAFLRAGIDAVSCDLKPTRSPGPHFQRDVREVLYREDWAGIIAHPDCTYATNAGVRWLFDKGPSTETVLKGVDRWLALWNSAEFFRLFLDHPCQRVCIENPVPHKYAARLIGQKFTQTIQPYEYGHLETKRTALWLKGLPLLQPTSNVEAAMRLLPKRETHKVHYASPGADRAERRSVFFAGVGDAMAAQWGRLAPIALAA